MAKANARLAPIAIDAGHGIARTCYAAGTRIATEAGETDVEDIQPGESVRTMSGRLAPVAWVGRTQVDLLRHPRPWHAAPVVIAADAFGPGLPRRDLRVSPDHAILVGGVLIPARLLVNGASVRRQSEPETVTYLHVELDRHDILLAEGLPAESYLDTGNRSLFAGERGVRRLYPDFTATPGEAAQRAYDEHGCAPLMLAGPAVASAHASLLSRAKARGHRLTDDPALLIEADAPGMSAVPHGLDTIALDIPAGARPGSPADVREVRLRSRHFVPEDLDPACGDGRRLGIAVAVRLNGRALPRRTYARGWHTPEPGMDWRWTDGDAVLALPVGPKPLRLTLRMMPAGASYWAPALAQSRDEAS